ncbi:MAG: thioredoxin domain-containing protein [Nitrospirales bacterium]
MTLKRQKSLERGEWSSGKPGAREPGKANEIIRFPRNLHRAILGGLALLLMSGVTVVWSENSESAPLAEVNGQAITVEDLERALGAKLAKLQEEIYTIKRKELQAMIADRLLAQEAEKRGISIKVLMEEEVMTKVGVVLETEITAAVQANKSQMEMNEDDFRKKIREALYQQKVNAQFNRFLDTLRARSDIRISLRPPPVIRLEVSTDGAPFRGMAEAPVTLVEFSDFHCPFCKRVQPTLGKVLERYPKNVKLVFRDFPLDKLHPQARRAAEAARCTIEQGKFWEYHDLLFTNAPRASSEDLRTYAGQVGLDESQFQSCLSDGGQQAAVQQDVEEGVRLGITGTPMFFINGRPLSGALPLERFVQVIEEELVRHPVTKEKVDSGG